jgi:hypothetical protein
MITIRFALACLFGLVTSSWVHASESAEEMALKVIEMQASQLKAFREMINTQSDSAFVVVKEDTTLRDGQSERGSKLELGVRQPKGGLFLSVMGDTSLSLSLRNNRYAATLTKPRSEFSPKRLSEIQIEKLANASMVLNTFSPPNDAWLDDVIPAALTQVYFAFGGKLFESQYKMWREAKQMASTHTASIGKAKRTNCSELIFEGWPNSNERMTYVIDNTGLVYEMHRVSSKQSTHYNVEEFFDIKGIKVPLRFSVKLSVIDSNLKAETRGEWQKIPLDEIGFESAQLVTSYYGLPEPDLEELPEKAAGYPWVWIVSVAIIAGGGGYYVYRKQLS